MGLTTNAIVAIILGAIIFIGLLISIVSGKTNIISSIKTTLLSLVSIIGNMLAHITPTTIKTYVIDPIKHFFTTDSPIRALFFLAIVLVPSILIYVYSSNSTFQTFSLWAGIILMILGGLVFASRVNTSATKTSNAKTKGTFSIITSAIKPFMLLLVGLIAIGGAIYMISSFDTVSSMISYVTIIAGVIGGLYLLHTVLSKTALYQKLEKGQLFKILYHSIFLIPCYIITAVKGATTSVKKEPSFTYYLLIAEALIIASYFLLPKLYTYIFTHNGSQLLNKPIYLDNATQVGTFENLKQDKGFNYHYALSFWAFIDQNNKSNAASQKNAVILDYGGKPSVMYNVNKNKLIIKTKNGIDGEKQIYVNKNLPLQRWNNFVINYNSGTMDIFLNGTLVATEKKIMPYMTLDDIVVGSVNGIHGGIANVMYYNQSLSAYKIKTLYSYFKNKTPPTI